ncbi:MAG: glycosyltransferase family 2 protein [Bacteroidia bacterium]
MPLTDLPPLKNTDSEMPKISIITINYNDKTGLEKTIASVLEQTFSDMEYIVIDGGSTDGSVDVIRRHEGRIAHWTSEKDSGIFNAQNKGGSLATGEYLLFLNSGDLLADKDVLAAFAPQLQAHDLVYGDLVVDNGRGRERNDMPDQLSVYFFMIASLAHPSTFISTTLFKKLNGYREELRIVSDFEFFLRAVLVNGASYFHVPLPVAVFNTNGISSDPKNEERQKWERKQSWEMNFSTPVVFAFEEYTKLLRSSDLKVGKLVKKIINPFKAR